MGNNASTRLRKQISVTEGKQGNACKELRELAQKVREEQQKFHKAKLKANAVSSVGGAMTLIGIAAAPVTGGASLALAIPGAGGTILGGAGDLAASILESQVLGPMIDKVNSLLNDVLEETLILVEATNLKISRRKNAINLEDCIINNMKIESKRNYGGKVTKAMRIINVTLEALRLSNGIKRQQFGMHDISEGISADKVRKGFTVMRAVGAGNIAKSSGKVMKAAGGATFVGLGLAFDIKSMIENHQKIASNYSEVADSIEEIADTLSKTQ